MRFDRAIVFIRNSSPALTHDNVPSPVHFWATAFLRVSIGHHTASLREDLVGTPDSQHETTATTVGFDKVTRLSR